MNEADWTPELVAAFRDHLGSQVALARKMRVTPKTIRRWINGTSPLLPRARYQLTNIARRNGFTMPKEPTQ